MDADGWLIGRWTSQNGNGFFGNYAGHRTVTEFKRKINRIKRKIDSSKKLSRFFSYTSYSKTFLETVKKRF